MLNVLMRRCCRVKFQFGHIENGRPDHVFTCKLCLLYVYLLYNMLVRIHLEEGYM